MGTHHDQGWVLDPDRKKMSKSKGNVITPHALIEEHGAEAVRYWSCNGRPGTDTARRSPRCHEDRVPSPTKILMLHVSPSRVRRGRRCIRYLGVTRSLDAGRPRKGGGAGDSGVRRVRLRPCPRDRRTIVLDLDRRLPRAGQGASVRGRWERGVLRLMPRCKWLSARICGSLPHSCPS